MREIIFKAKRVDNGEWVEGFLFKMQMDDGYTWCIGEEPLTANDYSEIVGCGRTWFFINHHTLCQYTGLTDKNGNKIWENDVVYIPYARLEDSYCKVVFRMGGFIGEMADGCEDCLLNRKIEVIGNIFDNEDLLKGE